MGKEQPTDLEQFMSEDLGGREEGEKPLKPGEFETAEEKIKRMKKRQQEIAEFSKRAEVRDLTRIAGESARSLVEILKTSPELMNNAIQASLESIQAASGTSEDDSRILLKNLLIESLRTIKDEQLADRVILAIDELTKKPGVVPEKAVEEKAV